MRRRPVDIIYLGTLITIVALLAAGCGQVSQNDNGNQNRNTAVNANQKRALLPETELDAATLAAFEEACAEPDLEKRRGNVEKKLKDDIDPDTVMGGHVKVEARKLDNAYIEVLLEGTIRQFEKMNRLKALLSAVSKKGCVQRVVFVPPETIGSKTVEGLQFNNGFVWACESPYVLCSNGRCLPEADCNKLAPTSTPVPNANSGSGNNSANTNSGNRNRP